MAMSDTIAQKIKAELSPQKLDVKDVSDEHAGHAAWLAGSSLSNNVTSKPFFCKNKALHTPWIPAPIIPILNFFFI